MKRVASYLIVALFALFLAGAPVMAQGHNHCGGITGSWTGDHCYADCENAQDCFDCVRDNYNYHCTQSCELSFHPSQRDRCPDICRDTMIRSISKCIAEFSLPKTTSSGYDIDVRCWDQTNNLTDCQTCAYEVASEAESICDTASSNHEVCDALQGWDGSYIPEDVYEQYCQYAFNGGPSPDFTLLP